MTKEAFKMPNQASVQLNIEYQTSLNELIEQVNAACDQMKHQCGPLIIQLGHYSENNKDWPGHVDIQTISHWERAIRRLERLQGVIIAVIEGMIGGPGLELLLITDYRIATTNSQLHLPINNGHLWPGMALHRLVHQLGAARARQFLLGVEKVTVQHLLGIGLIDEITEDVDSAVERAIIRLNVVSGKEYSVRRQLLLEAMTTSYEEALGTHLAACDRELRRFQKEKSEQSFE